jgi:hypothetical protein
VEYESRAWTPFFAYVLHRDRLDRTDVEDNRELTGHNDTRMSNNHFTLGVSAAALFCPIRAATANNGCADVPVDLRITEALAEGGAP